MNKGLIIGKFMPPHLGHLGLIRFAAKRCDKLTVAVCSRPNEPISGLKRYRWMNDLLIDYENIEIAWIRAELPQDKKASRNASKIWSNYLLQRFNKIDLIFTSEKYGDFLAEYMGAKHISYDSIRSKFPISATMIRKKPFKNWKFIPEIVKPYYIKKICIYGPESTGKSTLASRLALHYKTIMIPEYAREYLGDRGNNFNLKDIVNIAKGQLRSEQLATLSANKFLFCDTDLITTSIYSHNYLGKCPELVEKLADSHYYDLYLYMDIDINWVKDNLRDLGDRRMEFRKIFLDRLKSKKYPFTIISGKGEARVKAAITTIDRYFRYLF
jgi:HTH-type transcriptional regulator, transcriptional repressor of NAD biosynthesis genes